MILLFLYFLYTNKMPPTCQSCITAVATHGKKGGSKQYCKNCAKGIEDVGDLTRKHCKEETCFKEPTYNYPTEKTTAYCKTHMKPGMEDIKHKKCEYVDEEGNRCKSLPTYGIQGGHPIYCKPHSDLFENMIIRTNKLCKYKDENGVACIK